MPKGIYKRTKRNFLERFWEKIDKRGPTECWPWFGCLSKAGYGQIHLNGKTTYAHVISFELAHGHNYFDTCHKCDYPACCNPKHLFSGTHKQNMNDRDLKKRQSFGSKMGNARFTEKDIINIRKKYVPRKYSTIKIAKEYGVSPETIWHIIARKTWRHI